MERQHVPGRALGLQQSAALSARHICVSRYSPEVRAFHMALELFCSCLKGLIFLPERV